MERAYPHLFSPITVRGKLFKNRILAAPIGAWVFSPQNYIFDYAIDAFAEKAVGGAAAVTVGHTEVNNGEPDEDGFGLYFNLRGRNGTAALTEFAEAIRSRGCHVSAELNYDGMNKGDKKDGEFWSVSGYTTPDGIKVREMDEEKIAKTIRQYADCAARLKNSGFDMVTVHGAHGWLPELFRSSKTNHRTDRFGGSAENRMRFPIMLIDAVRQAVGENVIIEYRMGGANPETDPGEFQEILDFVRAIEDKIDILHLSTSFDEKLHERTIPTYFLPRAVNVPYAKALKAAGVKVPIALVGAINTPELAEEIIRDGIADFTAMGRPLIADPHFPNKARQGRAEDITPCIGCLNCLCRMHTDHVIRCTVNPRSGREHRIPPASRAAEKKRVAVVGGGPAGMQAAITACDRGHRVTLYEKSSRLGGILNISEHDPIKYLMRDYRDYLIRQVEKRDITVYLNTEADAGLVEAAKPDAVLVAVGAEPIIPGIQGVDGGNTVTALETFFAPDKVGRRAVIVGGNLVGCETALYLRGLGREVTVAESRSALYMDANPAIAEALGNRMGGITALTDSTCVKITENSVTLRRGDELAEIPADTVVLAVGMRAKSEIFYGLYDTAPEVIPVGDCAEVSNIYGAVHSAFGAASCI